VKPARELHARGLILRDATPESMSCGSRGGAGFELGRLAIAVGGSLVLLLVYGKLRV